MRAPGCERGDQGDHRGNHEHHRTCELHDQGRLGVRHRQAFLVAEQAGASAEQQPDGGGGEQNRADVCGTGLRGAAALSSCMTK
jgi:hypothetical protein